MNIPKDWSLTKFADEYIVVPLGADAEKFKGIIRLNDTGAFIWCALCDGLSEEQIADKILEEYTGVERGAALSSVRKLVEKLQAEGLMED